MQTAESVTDRNVSWLLLQCLAGRQQKNTFEKSKHLLRLQNSKSIEVAQQEND